MKLWIRHEDRLNGCICVAPYCAAFSKEEAIKLAMAHNKYLSLSDRQYKAVDVQEVEIDSDQLIYELLTSFGTQEWTRRIYLMIEKKNPCIKYGEIITVPFIEPIVLD